MRVEDGMMDIDTHPGAQGRGARSWQQLSCAREGGGEGGREGGREGQGLCRLFNPSPQGGGSLQSGRAQRGRRLPACAWHQGPAAACLHGKAAGPDERQD
jgi:hypothetical protein